MGYWSMNIDIALRVDSPSTLTYESTFKNKRKMEMLEKSNCTIIMEKVVLNAFQGTIFENINTK